MATRRRGIAFVLESANSDVTDDGDGRYFGVGGVVVVALAMIIALLEFARRTLSLPSATIQLVGVV